MNKSLHIVSFDNPYPPKYGGVIDVFYKIEALNKLGITIILHIFSDEEFIDSNLKTYCSKIFFYKRNSLLSSLLSTYPYRVKSRFSKELIKNLTLTKAPILFEGLHSTFVLTKFECIHQKIYLRTHNIEHLYHNGLAKSSINIFEKIFFKLESLKFKRYEKIINSFDGLFTISPHDQSYFSNKYKTDTNYIPAFHQNSKLNCNTTKNQTILFHGDLRVADNIKASFFLIDTFKNTNFKLVIASSTPNRNVIKKLSKNKHHAFINVTDNHKLNKLLDQSHINVLVTFQKAGIKLKLINALYKGKFVIVNTKMIEGTGLESLCEVANSKKEFLHKTKQLLKEKFTQDQLSKRKKSLSNFDTKKSAQKIIDVIFN